MRNILKISLIVFTCIFSLACGFLLVQFLIPLYFKLFSPIPKTLNNFYIAVGVASLLLLVLAIILLKTGKYNWGVWILGTMILLLGFGMPMFMLENNNMIWHNAVFRKTGPAYFIEFSEKEIYALKYIYNLYTMLWDRIYLYVYAIIIIYLAAYLYLRKQGWRIRGFRIKS